MKEKDRVEKMQEIGVAVTNAVNALKTSPGNPFEFALIVKSGKLYSTTINMGSNKELQEIIRSLNV